MVWIGLLTALASPQELTLTPGLVIASSAKVQPGEYALASADDSGKSGVITIRGTGITVDFTGATLLGSSWETPPDQRKGTAVVVDGTNITIKGLKVHGYKIGLIARNSSGLKIEGCDFSYNWKQRLNSTDEREDSSDWMSYHKNESDEWLRFGAGIYLRDCANPEVKGCRIVGGQCGLMMTGCNGGKVWNNSFSFLSAIGLGMYRSSDNKVMHNNIDWCVRGYSHTRWNRGQDSAGILIYEQSNKNVFAYNSVTHGGDGFFLWAGQTTMDTGNGGCNDNLLFGNDFSHAPTNGIEATFSRNKFFNNLVMECWHGIWGGFGFESETVGNVFAYNGQAIAWEHGQKNRVTNNLFFHDTEGVAIWMNQNLDPNWNYPKAKDTASRDWTFRANEFNLTATNAFSIRDTKNVEIARNYLSSIGTLAKTDGSNPGLKVSGNWLWIVDRKQIGTFTDNNVTLDKANKAAPALLRPDGNNLETPWVSTEDYINRFNLMWAPFPKDPQPDRGMKTDAFMKEYYYQTRLMAPKPLEGGKRPFIKPGQLRGRRYIVVDEWGPYDFKSPKIVARGERNGKLQFELLGPAGKWRVVEKRGVASIDKESGDMPDTIHVALIPGQANDIVLALEFVGADVTTPFGKKIKAGTPYRFEYSKFFAPIDWDVRIYSWDKAAVADPLAKMPALSELKLSEPVKAFKATALDLASGGAFVEGAPNDYFATIAEGAFEIGEGEYTLQVTTDDGCRVWVDDKLVITDAWKYQGPTNYSANLQLGGKHRVRVEHYEINGYSALKVGLVRAKPSAR